MNGGSNRSVFVGRDVIKGWLRLLLNRLILSRSVFGRDVIGSLIVTGDRNQIFLGPYEPLRDAYIWPGSIFQEVDPGRFVGRKWLLKKVDDFLKNNPCGYFILEAEAGLGKTAFLAWLVKERGYIHHFTEQEPNPVNTVKNLAAQLMLVYLGAAGVKSLPTAAARPDYLYRLLYQAAAKRQPGEKIVIVIDALDAANMPPDQSKQNVLGLPGTLPDGVFIIASQRPVPVRLYIDVAKTPQCVFKMATGTPENQDDMRCFLEQAATWPGVARALQKGGYTEEQFVNVLMEKSRGLWIYLHYVVDEIEKGLRSPLDLNALPDGLTLYYINHWQGWRAQNETEWYNLHLPLLATLAAVRQAITIEQLTAWAGVGISNEGISRLLRTEWRPFIAVVQSTEDRFQFYHATLRDFWEGKVMGGKLKTDEEAFVSEVKGATIKACRRIVQNADAPKEVRRDAALRLMSMRWLDKVRDASEMCTLLELIGNYVHLPADLDYLVQMITCMLKSASLDDRSKASLLVYRAGMRGKQSSVSTGEEKSRLLGLAEEDYQSAEGLVRNLIAPDGQLEDYRMLARILLGRANIALERSRDALAQGDQVGAQNLGQEAVRLLRDAAEQADKPGLQDILISIYGQLCYAHTVWCQWEEAEQSYSKALKVLDDLRASRAILDPLYYSDYAWIVGTASHMHLQHAQSLTGKAALDEYAKAYDLAQKEIKVLGGSPVAGDEVELVAVHITAGDCQWAMIEQDPGKATELRRKACEHWKKAEEIAKRINYPLDSLIEQSPFKEALRECLGKAAMR